MYEISLLKSLIASLSKVTLTYCAYRVTCQHIVCLSCYGIYSDFRRRDIAPRGDSSLPGFPNYLVEKYLVYFSVPSVGLFQTLQHRVISNIKKYFIWSFGIFKIQIALSSELVFIKSKNTILRPLRHTYLLKTTVLLQLLHVPVFGGFYLKKKKMQQMLPGYLQ